MRRAALILSLSLVFAAPVGAQSANDAPRLRGAQPTPPSETPAPTSAMPAASAGMTLAPPGPDAGRCRLSCAQSYYFCLASDTPDDCPGAWSQCRAACDSPLPPPGG